MTSTTENILLEEQQSHNLHAVRREMGDTHTPEKALDRLCQEFARRHDSLRVSLSGEIERIGEDD